MNSQRLALVCDSGCDVPQEYVDAYNIHVIPLNLIYPDGTYKSGADITTEQVIQRFATDVPTTSLPSPMDIENILNKVEAEGYDQALYIGLSSTLSSTSQTVRMVGRMMENLEVHIVDTKNIGLGAGMSVIAAGQMLEAGMDADAIIARLEKLVDVTALYFVTDTLEYLHRGGRISDTTYRLGTALNIKPVITCAPDGSYVTAKKTRGLDRAIRAEVSMINSRMEGFSRVRIGISCTKQADFVDDIKKQLKARMGNIESIITGDISAALVVHTGPKLVGICAQPDWRDL